MPGAGAPTQFLLVPAALRDAGYATHFVGKWYPRPGGSSCSLVLALLPSLDEGRYQQSNAAKKYRKRSSSLRARSAPAGILAWPRDPRNSPSREASTPPWAIFTRRTTTTTQRGTRAAATKFTQTSGTATRLQRSTAQTTRSSCSAIARSRAGVRRGGSRRRRRGQRPGSSVNQTRTRRSRRSKRTTRRNGYSSTTRSTRRASGQTAPRPTCSRSPPTTNDSST